MNTLDVLFKQVHAINEMVGNPANADKVALARQAKLLLHEVEELIEAIDKDDIEGIRDGQADVAFVLAGFEYMFKPLAPDLKAVVNSNVTKFDSDEEAAIETRKKYSAQGIKTKYVRRPVNMTYGMGMFSNSVYYVTYVDGEQLMNGQMVPDGKWLKSYKYQEPQFS